VPLRVLYLIPTLHVGGAERVVIEHLRRLPRDRFAPELALLHAEGPLRAQLPGDVPLHVLPASRFPRTLGRRRALRRLIEERGIDVVSSHGSHVNFLNLAEAFGRSRRVARVLTIHLDRRGLDRATAASRLRFRLQRALAREAGRVVFLCRETAEGMARAYGLRREQVAVIPNGVDPPEILALSAGEPPPWPSRGLRLLAVGRLGRQKGFDLLLRAFALARRRGLDASLLILGEGPARAELERLRGELDLDDVAALPGVAPNPYPALRHSDLFVQSSRYEGFPLVLLEALALGRPIVAAACLAGPAELLGEGAGVLVPPGDTESLASAILKLASDRAWRLDLSRRAAERAGAYLWSSVIERTAALLEEAATARA
jgi:glycosyltransferase involved in cell wall biosynthesis